MLLGIPIFDMTLVVYPGSAVENQFTLPRDHTIIAFWLWA
jgi:hypothetical protein